MRNRLAWTRRSTRPATKNAVLRTSLPSATAGAAGARGELRQPLVGRRRDDDEDVVEARAVDRGDRLDLLVAAELALDDLRDPRDREATREPLPFAARHEEITDFDLVARVDHLDLARIALRIAGAAHEAARVRALVLHVDPEGGVDAEPHVDRVA